MRALLRVVGAAVLAAGCGADADHPPLTISYSFETDLEGWTADGTDLELGEGQIAWSIEHSRERAFDGTGSVHGVASGSPETRDDLVYQGETGNGADTNVGYVWLEKAYAFDVTAGPDGRLHVFLGAWGTWEGPRTYFVDRLRITMSPR